MKPIKFRFWNTDYKNPIMEYGSTDDIKFVERSIGKDKMLFVAEILGKSFYEKDICKIHNTTEFSSSFNYYGIVVWSLFGYNYKIINRQNMHDDIYGMNVNDEIVGNFYETPHLLNHKHYA